MSDINKNTFTINGVVIKKFPGVAFKVKLDNGHEIMAHAAGKLRNNKIRIILGDKVTVECNKDSLDKGRIIHRLLANAKPVFPSPLKENKNDAESGNKNN